MSENSPAFDVEEEHHRGFKRGSAAPMSCRPAAGSSLPPVPSGYRESQLENAQNQDRGYRNRRIGCLGEKAKRKADHGGEQLSEKIPLFFLFPRPPHRKSSAGKYPQRRDQVAEPLPWRRLSTKKMEIPKKVASTVKTSEMLNFCRRTQRIKHDEDGRGILQHMALARGQFIGAHKHKKVAHRKNITEGFGCHDDALLFNAQIAQYGHRRNEAAGAGDANGFQSISLMKIPAMLTGRRTEHLKRGDPLSFRSA
jgi:hypothetical protein